MMYKTDVLPAYFYKTCANSNDRILSEQHIVFSNLIYIVKIVYVGSQNLILILTSRTKLNFVY